MAGDMREKNLLIIGAGPKALAIAAKACALRALGFRVPNIHIVERTGIAAHWNGKGGYTNGKMFLATSPEKDVGFPYRSAVWGRSNAHVDRAMQSFSWQAHLIETGRFQDWFDRNRPAIEHRQWAAYLEWVSRQVKDGTTFHFGELYSLSLRGTQWQARIRRNGGNDEELIADGVVVTGPGRVRLPEALPVSDNVLSIETFWHSLDKIAATPDARVALIGSGESASSIALALTLGTRNPPRVDIITSLGTTYSRGESYRENVPYSDPEGTRWRELSEAHRREFIHRTDRAVFSQFSQHVFDSGEHIHVVPGRLEAVTRDSSGKLDVSVDYHGRKERESYDFVVCATGFDNTHFVRKWLDTSAMEETLSRIGAPALTDPHVEKRIGRDLSIEGLVPRLHLPMLAGVAQGPGFPILSCLGFSRIASSSPIYRPTRPRFKRSPP